MRPNPPPGNTQASFPRSVFITLLAWTIIVVSALLIPISVITVLMILAGSYGTSTVDPIGFLGIVVAPPASLAGGIGLLKRQAWARYYVIGLLSLLIACNGWQLMTARPETTTYTSNTGVTTTVETSFGSNFHQLPIMAICTLLLVGLFRRSVRDEFRRSRRAEMVVSSRQDVVQPPATPAGEPPAVQRRPAAATTFQTTRKQQSALFLVIVLLMGIAGGMGWLVTSGVSNGTTYFPAKRASQQRTVTRQNEPATFWLSIGVYSAVGLGTGGMALWCIRQTCRRNP